MKPGSWRSLDTGAAAVGRDAELLKLFCGRGCVVPSILFGLKPVLLRGSVYGKQSESTAASTKQ